MADRSFNTKYPITKNQIAGLRRNIGHLRGYRGNGHIKHSFLSYSEYYDHTEWYIFEKDSNCDMLLMSVIWSPFTFGVYATGMTISIYEDDHATLVEAWELDAASDADFTNPALDNLQQNIHLYDIADVTTYGYIKVEIKGGTWAHSFSCVDFNPDDRGTAWERFEDISGKGNIHDAGLLALDAGLDGIQTYSIRHYGELDIENSYRASNTFTGDGSTWERVHDENIFCNARKWISTDTVQDAYARLYVENLSGTAECRLVLYDIGTSTATNDTASNLSNGMNLRQNTALEADTALDTDIIIYLEVRVNGTVDIVTVDYYGG